MADQDSTRSPAFQFYPADFIAGTVTLTTEEIGAYVLLLCHAWDKVEVPADINLLARIARLTPVRMRRAWLSLEGKFQRTNSGYIQPRIERERRKQEEFRRRQSDNGKRGGRPRKPDETQTKAVGYSGLTQTESQTKPKKSSSSSSSSSSSDFSQRERPTRTLPERAGAFVEWYQDKHFELFGIGYLGNPQKDYGKALQLCEVFKDNELRDAALVWFGQDDDFATSGTRTISKFASRASDCVLTARKVTQRFSA